MYNKVVSHYKVMTKQLGKYVSHGTEIGTCVLWISGPSMNLHFLHTKSYQIQINTPG